MQIAIRKTDDVYDEILVDEIPIAKDIQFVSKPQGSGALFYITPKYHWGTLVGKNISTNLQLSLFKFNFRECVLQVTSGSPSYTNCGFKKCVLNLDWYNETFYLGTSFGFMVTTSLDSSTGNKLGPNMSEDDIMALFSRIWNSRTIMKPRSFRKMVDFFIPELKIFIVMGVFRYFVEANKLIDDAMVFFQSAGVPWTQQEKDLFITLEMDKNL